MFGIVIDVSATFVATTISRAPAGGGSHTRICAVAGSREYSGSTCTGPATPSSSSSGGTVKNPQERSPPEDQDTADKAKAAAASAAAEAEAEAEQARADVRGEGAQPAQPRRRHRGREGWR